jgi:hypothetical protein
MLTIAFSVMVARATPRRFQIELAGELFEIPANIAHQHVGQLVSEPVAHHHTLHYHILPVGRHAVGGHLPAAITRPFLNAKARCARSGGLLKFEKIRANLGVGCT